MGQLRDEGGFGMIEMLIAAVVLSIALLTLAAGYEQAALALHSSAQKSAAANLAQQQLEAFSAADYCSIALNPTSLSAAVAADAFYSPDKSSLSPAGTDVTTTCTNGDGTHVPVQTLTGSDNRWYRVETFIRQVAQSLSPSGTTTERVVTVIVRDPGKAGTPVVYTANVAFDCGPRGGSCT